MRTILTALIIVVMCSCYGSEERLTEAKEMFPEAIYYERYDGMNPLVVLDTTNNTYYFIYHNSLTNGIDVKPLIKRIEE